VQAGAEAPLATTIPGEIAAESGTGTHRLACNSHVWNILPGMQLIILSLESISHFISATYVLPRTAPSNLTPYSAIFCKLILVNQPLARHPRKIFKTGNLKVNHFNILQINVCNLLKPEIFFTFS
jgi:hypothetical protein